MIQEMMIDEDTHLTIEQILPAEDWWVLVAFGPDGVEEHPVMAFAQCTILVNDEESTTGKTTLHETRPILQNFAGDVGGYYGTVYAPELRDHGKIVSMHKGKGNHTYEVSIYKD